MVLTLTLPRRFAYVLFLVWGRSSRIAHYATNIIFFDFRRHWILIRFLWYPFIYLMCLFLSAHFVIWDIIDFHHLISSVLWTSSYKKSVVFHNAFYRLLGSFKYFRYSINQADKKFLVKHCIYTNDNNFHDIINFWKVKMNKKFNWMIIIVTQI